MEFYNNKNNDTLKFKINSEGIDTNKMEPRLILTTNENKNYLFIGKIDGEICKFNIPELKEYNKDDNGKIKFEIISEDLYFPVWEDRFKVKTKSTVKMEEVISEAKEEETTRPIINASMVIEDNNIDTDEDEDTDEDNKKDKKTKDLDDEHNKHDDDSENESRQLHDKQIKNFSKFLNNHGIC